MSSEALERTEALLAVAAWWFAAARDMAREVAKLEAALAVARERDQRLREKIMHVIADSPGTPATVKQFLRAALVDEPAPAAPGAISPYEAAAYVGPQTTTSAFPAADDPTECPRCGNETTEADLTYSGCVRDYPTVDVDCARCDGCGQVESEAVFLYGGGAGAFGTCPECGGSGQVEVCENCYDDWNGCTVCMPIEHVGARGGVSPSGKERP